MAKRRAGRRGCRALVELLLVGGVVGDGGGRVFELVAGEDADDAVARGDDPLLTSLRARRRWRRWPARSRGRRRDLRLGVENLLVGHLADDAVAALRAPAGTWSGSPAG